MAHKILKSLLPTTDAVNAFQRLCNNQINEMRAYDKQVAMNKKDPKTYHLYPAPQAHPDIIASIVTEGDDYNLSFEIVDDTPVPTLADKKMALNIELNKLIFEAQESIIPTVKRNLLGIKASKAFQIDEKKRTKAQAADVIALDQYSDKLAALSEYHAQCASDIYDLTDETVDAYKPPPVPKGN